MNIPDPYKVLQVDPEAEDEVIEAAYRRLAKKYHPDVSPGPDAQERMVRINQAWELLRDPARRAAVDRARSRSATAAARVAAAEGRARAASHAAAQANQRPAHRTTSGHAGSPRREAPPREWGFPGVADPGDVDFRARPQYVSPNWTSGRSSAGHQYDPGTMGTAQGDGAAGPPPGNPSGSVLTFGRYAGWSLGEIARTDLEYLEWLDRMPIGRTYQTEIDALLRSHQRRRTAPTAQHGDRGLFRRR
ncbi:MAG TPA: J domain-containing protein [Candidatus Limnocylindrales bacterium]|nr:J domain-containing protein [Candidatus Limnocylindrales bacterium]